MPSFNAEKYITETRKGCGTQLMAVHVHHGIRGAEADSDAAFCKALCEEQGIEYREYCYDVPRLAKERGCGEEEMGRLLRYGAFRENIDNLPMGIKGVAAVAHHQNDQAETVLSILPEDHRWQAQEAWSRQREA